MKIRIQLQAYLQKHDMNASQLARKAGIPRQTVSDWLGGTTPKNLVYIKKVADALQISIEELCFGEAKETSKKESVVDLESLIGTDWISGQFEVRLRRIKK